MMKIENEGSTNGKKKQLLKLLILWLSMEEG